MFAGLFDKYKKTEYKTVVLSQRGEGSGMFIFDVNKEISDDWFCLVEFMSTLGQTQYFVYKRDGEDIWYFHKKAYFYEGPMKLENAEIRNTYFKYTNDLPYAFNEATGEYDIQADTNKYQAITDVRSLTALIEIVQNAEASLMRPYQPDGHPRAAHDGETKVYLRKQGADPPGSRGRLTGRRSFAYTAWWGGICEEKGRGSGRLNLSMQPP
jgi:hypothetical protein